MARKSKFWATCRCGKRGYGFKKDAKAFMRATHPGAAMSVYLCDLSSLWHCGHLPKEVADGSVDRGILHAEPAVTTATGPGLRRAKHAQNATTPAPRVSAPLPVDGKIPSPLEVAAAMPAQPTKAPAAPSRIQGRSNSSGRAGKMNPTTGRTFIQMSHGARADARMLGIPVTKVHDALQPVRVLLTRRGGDVLLVESASEPELVFHVLPHRPCEVVRIVRRDAA